MSFAANRDGEVTERGGFETERRQREARYSFGKLGLMDWQN